MAEDRSPEIRETFRRIRRPLQWPMSEFRRTRVVAAGFTGYRFTRVRRGAVAGFAFGFALREGVLPVDLEPPEAIAYAFVRPLGSDLYRSLVSRARSPVRDLVKVSEADGVPFVRVKDHEIAAIRHRPLGRVPPELFPLAASDFFMLSYRPLQLSAFIERVRKATTRPGP